MYSDRAKWIQKKSDHFVFKYLPDTQAETDLNDIIQKRELAYSIISSFLKVETDNPLTLYFSPNEEFCYSRNMLCQASVPHKYTASLIYNEHPLCFEKISYGHEIAHLLLYFWDQKMYHLEFLEEGLAVYLDQSGTNKHLDFYSTFQFIQGKKNIDLSLDILPISNCTNYPKAGSFVKFLIENYGLPKFKELYISSKIERENNIFKINSEKLPKNYLKTLLNKNYHKSPYMLQVEWLKNLGIIL